MFDLSHKIYQLIISRLDGDYLGNSSYREKTFDLVRKGIGGFIIFGGNKDEVKEFIHSLQSISDIPLFIASDIERGAGQQFKGATHFPSLMAISAAINQNDPSHVQILDIYIKSVAEEAIDIGINVPLIPVLDVNLNPDNPIICTRSFSDNPQRVSWFGRKYIEILQDAGLISCAKHFPGHGDTAIDSHISLPVILKSDEELMRSDLMPFKEAIKSGVGSIMMGHLSIPSIDTLPASLSKKIVTDLLGRLGYTGLVMTDALNMSALNEFENVPAKCIDAGIDILLHPADPIKTADELKLAVDTGLITEDKVKTAFKRVMQYKSDLKTFGQTNPDYDEHINIANTLFNKSITLVSGKYDSSAMIDLNKVDLIFTGDENRIDNSVLKQHMPNAVHISQYTGPFNDKIIIALFTTVAAWQGSSGISDDDREKIKQIINKAQSSIVISFGSPYVLSHFKKADMLIAAYDSSIYAQKAVFECLINSKGFKGSLPVKIDFL